MKSATATAKSTKAASATSPASSTSTPSSIHDRQLEKRRKVFKQSFDSPLKVKWGTPPSADLQSQLVHLLTTRLFAPTPTDPAPAFHRGLQSTFRLLAARIRNPLQQLAPDAQAKVPALAIVLFRGDLDETLAGPDLYGWVPGVAQLAKCAGHNVHVLVVTQVGASVTVSNAIRQRVEGKGGKHVPRCGCITIELQSNHAASNELVSLAAQYPTPTVPFYTATSDTTNLATFTEWAKLVNKPSLLSPSIKLLETSAPIVDRKQQREAKTAAKVEKAATLKAQPKPIQRKSGPQRSKKAQADKKRQDIAADIARAGPSAVPAFGCVAPEQPFATPGDRVRAMLKAKVELREMRDKKRTVSATMQEQADEAMDVETKAADEPKAEQVETAAHQGGSKKRSRSASESSAALPSSSLLDPAHAGSRSKKRRTT